MMKLTGRECFSKLKKYIGRYDINIPRIILRLITRFLGVEMIKRPDTAKGLTIASNTMMIESFSVEYILATAKKDKYIGNINFSKI